MYFMSDVLANEESIMHKYVVTNHAQYQNGWSISGHINVAYTAGFMQGEEWIDGKIEIGEWTFTLEKGNRKFVASSSNVGADWIPYGEGFKFVLTPSGLVVEAVGGYVAFRDPSGPKTGAIVVCWGTTHQYYAKFVSAGEEDLWHDVNVEPESPNLSIIIATKDCAAQ